MKLRYFKNAIKFDAQHVDSGSLLVREGRYVRIEKSVLESVPFI